MDVFKTLEAPLFQTHPTPMWICERETGLMMTANQAALTFYGYDERAFLTLNAYIMAPDAKIHTRAGGSHTRHLCSDGRWVTLRQECYEIIAYERPCLWMIAHPLAVSANIPESWMELITHGCHAFLIVLNERGHVVQCWGDPMGMSAQALEGRHYTESLPHTLSRP